MAEKIDIQTLWGFFSAKTVSCSLRVEGKKGGENMQIDRFTKACLLAIVILLSILFVKPMFEVRDSHAAKTIKYLVIPIPGGTEPMQQTLDKYGADGWELVALEEAMGNHFIFRK